MVASSQNLRNAKAQEFEHIDIAIPVAKNNLTVQIDEYCVQSTRHKLEIKVFLD